MPEERDAVRNARKDKSDVKRDLKQKQERDGQDAEAKIRDLDDKIDAMIQKHRRNVTKDVEQQARKKLGEWVMEQINIHEDDRKPLMTWMDKLEAELKRLKKSYKGVDPKSALEMYYSKVDPKSAAKKLAGVKESLSIHESWKEKKVLQGLQDQMNPEWYRTLKISNNSQALNNIINYEMNQNKNNINSTINGIIEKYGKTQEDYMKKGARQSLNEVMSPALLKKLGIENPLKGKGYPYQEARQLKDPKKEVMVHKNGKGVIVIDKKDQKKYLSKGWTLAEALNEGRKPKFKKDDFVQWKGKKGIIVRYDDSGPASPFYIVSFKGQYMSLRIPQHKLEESVELNNALDMLDEKHPTFVKIGYSKIMKGIRDSQGPFSVVAIQGKKVVGNKHSIKNSKMLPIHVNQMADDHPLATISIESKDGKILNTFNESVQLDELDEKEKIVVTGEKKNNWELVVKGKKILTGTNKEVYDKAVEMGLGPRPNKLAHNKGTVAIYRGETFNIQYVDLYDVWKESYLGEAGIKTRTFEFPDSRKAKQFAKDISNSAVATGTVSGNRVIDVELLHGNPGVANPVIQRMLKTNHGKVVKEETMTFVEYFTEVELDEADPSKAPVRQSAKAIFDLYKTLKPKQVVEIWYDSSIKKAKNWTKFQVGRKSKSKKYNSEKITLTYAGGTTPHRGKYYLYNRDGKVSFAIGDMATSMVAIRKSTAESVELDEATKKLDGLSNNAKGLLASAINFSSSDSGPLADIKNLDKFKQPAFLAAMKFLDKNKSAFGSGFVGLHKELKKFFSRWAHMESVEHLDEVKWDKDEKRIVPKWEQDLHKATSKIKGIVRGMKNGKEVHSYRSGGTMMASAVGVLLRDFGADTVELVVRGKVVYTVKKKDVMKNGKMIDESVELDEDEENWYRRGGGMFMNRLKDLITKYKKTGRTAFHYPKKKQISLDGRTMSEKDAINKMKRVVGESVELDESKMSELHMLIQDGKTAQQIAKIMKIDVKTIKTLMKGFKESLGGPGGSSRRVSPADMHRMVSDREKRAKEREAIRKKRNKKKKSTLKDWFEMREAKKGREKGLFTAVAVEVNKKYPTGKFAGQFLNIEKSEWKDIVKFLRAEHKSAGSKINVAIEDANGKVVKLFKENYKTDMPYPDSSFAWPKYSLNEGSGLSFVDWFIEE